MSSQYDEIQDKYDNIKYIPAGLLEQATVQKHIGNAQGLEVLDLACGAGFYSRKLVSWGAQRVVGLDVSEGMVQTAQSANPDDKRLEFRVADCGQRVQAGPFDLVLAVWLLNYASTESELLTIWRNIFDNLRPGGRCLGITSNPDLLRRDSGFPHGPRSGLTMTETAPTADGMMAYQMYVHTSPPFVFDQRILERGLYEKTAHATGFCLRWLPAQAPDDSEVDFADLLRCPHLQAFEVVRPASS